MKTIKNKIKNFFDVRVESIVDKQQISFDYLQISQLFKEENFIPLSKWSISPSTILHILNDISINKRKNIIEFGSGSSTFYIAKLIKLRKMDAVFYSVDSDKEWVNELERQLSLQGLKEYVKIIYSPLRAVTNEISLDNQKTWYSAEIINSIIPDDQVFDLIVVDGPIGANSPLARYSAIPFLKKRIAKKFSIYLDDVEREDEQKILLKWQDELNCEVENMERYAVLFKATDYNVKPFSLK